MVSMLRDLGLILYYAELQMNHKIVVSSRHFITYSHVPHQGLESCKVSSYMQEAEKGLAIADVSHSSALLTSLVISRVL